MGDNRDFKQKVSAQRNSNIELLRIICIFFIILRHYSTQVTWGDITSDPWSWQRLFLQLITIGGSTSNNIFLLISGYFMIGKRVNFKRIVALIAEMFFYSWSIMLILFCTGIIPFSLKEMIKAIFPIWFGYNWYVCCYVIMCCFLPFINPFLDALSKDKYKKLLMVSILIWSVAYTFRATTYMGTDFSLDHFIIIYALGGYIRKYGLSLKELSWKTVFIVSGMLLVLSVVSMSCIGGFKNINILVRNATYFSSATNILDVIVATSLFLWGINAHPFYNKGVNALAKSVIGVFLIHHNPLMKQVIWEIVFPNVDYYQSSFLPIHCLVKVVSTFILCFMIDQIRFKTVDKMFTAFLDKNWEKISGGCIKIREKIAEYEQLE